MDIGTGHVREISVYPDADTISHLEVRILRLEVFQATETVDLSEIILEVQGNMPKLGMMNAKDKLRKRQHLKEILAVEHTTAPEFIIIVSDEIGAATEKHER